MRTSLLICVFLLIYVDPIFAQEQPSLDVNNLSEALAGIESTDLKTREAAFKNLVMALAPDGKNQARAYSPLEILNSFFGRYPEQVERVKLGLIQLLRTENEAFLGPNVPVRSHTEDDEEHFAEVIDFVSSLNDERAIPALAGAIATGGMAIRGLSKYGDAALGPVLNQLKSPNSRVRSAALGTALEILKSRKDTASNTRIKDLIATALSDPESVVRAKAVVLIDCLSTRRDFQPVLEKIAMSDPDRFPGKSDDGVDGDWYYPVRVQARRVLGNIQNNKACRP